MPVSGVLHGHDFWRRERGRLVATPLFVALVVIETTDIVFALDSVPAVLSVTRDPFIVYTSSYLRPGLAVILVFTGVKMLAARWVYCFSKT